MLIEKGQDRTRRFGAAVIALYEFRQMRGNAGETHFVAPLVAEDVLKSRLFSLNRIGEFDEVIDGVILNEACRRKFLASPEAP